MTSPARFDPAWLVARGPPGDKQHPVGVFDAEGRAAARLFHAEEVLEVALLRKTRKGKPQIRKPHLGPAVERLEYGYQLFSVVYFSRGTLPQKGKRALLGDLAQNTHKTRVLATQHG